MSEENVNDNRIDTNRIYLNLDDLKARIYRLEKVTISMLQKLTEIELMLNGDQEEEHT